MQLSKHPIRSLMAAAIALAALPAMAGESPYSKAVFFGDSLTDAGYFRPLLPEATQGLSGQFTTNPGWVWSQQVANYYGLNKDPNGNGQADEIPLDFSPVGTTGFGYFQPTALLGSTGEAAPVAAVAARPGRLCPS